MRAGKNTRPLAVGCGTVLALILGGCGGGGGGSGSDASTGSGSSQASTPPSLTVSTNSINVTGATNLGGNSVNNPLTFSVQNAASGTSYYYAVSYVGTAVSAITINGAGSTVYSTQNPTVGNAPKLASAIGATIHGAMLPGSDGSESDTFNFLTFVAPAQMGAGTYTDTITIKVCSDTACQKQISGSPQTISVTYRVTGNPIGGADLTVYPNVMVEAPSTQSTATSGSFNLMAANFPPAGVYVTWKPSQAGLVTSVALHTTLSPGLGTAATGAVSVNLPAPASLGAGIYSDSFQLNVCFDAACTKPVVGSPWTVNVRYVVDATAGKDYTLQTLPFPIAGMVWDSQTQRIYAIVPGYSPQYPNMLVQVNPASASVDTAVPLNGGVGNIEPGTLTVSDDGQYLYVAVSSASGLTDSVERILTSNLSLDLQISLPANNLVAGIREAPASPHILAIDFAPPSPGLYIYDDATATGPALSGTTAQSIDFAWSADATTLYAAIVTNTGGTIDTVANATGGPTVSQTAAFAALSEPAVTGSLYFVNNLLVWDSGATFNPASFTPGNAFALFASGTNTVTSDSVTFDTGLNRAYFFTTDAPAGSTSPGGTLQGSNLATQQPLWLARFSSGGGNVIRWGSNGIAFGQESSLVLISGSIVTQ
jgi:hypothetical protein